MIVTDALLISVIRNGFARGKGRNIEKLFCMMNLKAENNREVIQVLIIHVKSVVCT
jgi:hypothetical protein